MKRKEIRQSGTESEKKGRRRRSLRGVRKRKEVSGGGEGEGREGVST
jgi:hypothetical protein